MQTPEVRINESDGCERHRLIPVRTDAGRNHSSCRCLRLPEIPDFQRNRHPRLISWYGSAPGIRYVRHPYLNVQPPSYPSVRPADRPPDRWHCRAQTGTGSSADPWSVSSPHTRHCAHRYLACRIHRESLIRLAFFSSLSSSFPSMKWTVFSETTEWTNNFDCFRSKPSPSFFTGKKGTATPHTCDSPLLLISYL